MDLFPPGIPSRPEEYATFLLRPSSYEEDAAFRQTLTRITHTGFRWGGLAAVIGLLAYVVVETLLLGRPVHWEHPPGQEGAEVVLLIDLLLAGLCLGTMLIPWGEWSLRQCRSWAAAALLLGSGVFLRSDVIQGTVQIEYVALLYLLVVVLVPFRPWQIVGLGLGIGGVLTVLSAGVLVPESAAATVSVLPFLPSLGFATLLATLVGAVLYGTRLVQHRERERAQSVLRRSRDLLRRTQTVAGVGGWEYDPETDTLWGTEQTTELLDLPPDANHELETLVQAFAPDAQEELRAVLSRCLTEHEPFDRKLSRIGDEGEERWFRTRGEVRLTEDEGLRIAGTVEEVTERHKLQKQLRDREEWIRSIAENVPDGICRSAPGNGLVYVNQALAQMLGYDDPDDLLGKDPEDLYADAATAAELTRPEPSSAGSGGGVEVELQRRDGTTFPGLLNRREVLDEAGTVQYYDAIVTDITDQKRREEARRERRQKVEAVYTASVQLLRAEETAGVARQVHQVVADEFGCSFRSVLFREGEALVPSCLDIDCESLPWSVISIESEALPAEAFRSGETTLVSNLRERPTTADYGALTAVAFVPMGPHGVVAIGSDAAEGIPSFDLRLLEILAAHAAAVLDRIEREQRLLTAKEEAEEANRLKSALLANMSHEIRTPLTAINGFAEILTTEAEGTHADLAERIFRSGERLLETLTSLVQLSRLEAGEADLDREPVDLGQTVTEALETLRPRARDRSLRVVTEVPETSIVGAWNEGAVDRIATNLLENAIKFTPEGGRVCLQVWATDEQATLVVEDTGIGMSEAFQEVAFEAFQQESEGLDREYEGAGLGLAVVECLVQALDGSITLDSKKGEGTRVTVHLPRSTASESPHRDGEAREGVLSGVREPGNPSRS